MKKLLLTLALAVGAINSGFAADLYVNNSGQSGTYTSIQTALNVASSGDRIFVSPFGIYTEDLTISKSITIAPSVTGSNVVLNGSITFWPFANDTINLIGINGIKCDLTTNTISATVNTKAVINITGCTFSGNITLIHDAIVVNTFYSTCRSLYLKYGQTVANKITDDLRYIDGPNTVLSDTNFIVANLIGRYLDYQTDDFYYRISNNRCRRLYITRAVYNSNVYNYITNNWINDERGNNYYGIRFDFQSTGDNFSNVVVTGNVIHSIHTDGDPLGEHVQIVYFHGPTSTVLSNSNSPVIFYNKGLISTVHNTRSPLKYATYSSGNVTGSANEAYNSFSTERNTSMNGYLDYSGTDYRYQVLSPSDKSKVSGLEFFVDLNAPTTEYYDLDLTRGDLGTWGGPYSWDNYWNTNDGNARIIDINLPSEIWPGQTVNLKAEAVHTN